MIKHKGFTLVELLITVLVLVVLVVVAVPSMRDFVLNSRMSAHANEFVTSIQVARGNAVKQQRDAQICVSSDLATCTGGTDWSVGWIVWVDQDNDATLDAGEIIRVNEALSGTSTFTSAARTSFQYDPTGIVNAGDTLTLCDNRNGETGRTMTVTGAGRVSLARSVCP